MSQSSFKPTIFLKQGCPFCLKLRLYLLETGQLGQVEIVEPAPEDHQAMVDRLSPHFDRVTFPTAEIAPGQYLAGSDALIAHFKPDGVEPSELPTYQAYLAGVFPRFGQLFRENLELKKNLS